MHELKPKLFDIMKGYSKDQGYHFRYHCCHHRPSTFHCACHCFRCRTGTGTLHRDHCRLLYLFLRRKPCTDRRSDCCLRCHYLRNCRKLRNRRSDCRNHPRRYHSCDHGNLPLRFSDQVHSLHNYDRIYLRNRSHTFRRSAKRFLRNGNGICPI